MRSFYTLLFISVIFSITATCQSRKIIPSDKISTRVYSDFTGFKSLDLSNDLTAYVTFTDGPENIKIEANENLMPFINVDMDGSTLVVKMNGNSSIRGKATLNAYISTQSLRNFRASSDASIYLENTLEAEEAKITLRGDSKLEGKVSLKRLYLNLRGDSEIEIAGNTDELEAELRGDSVLESEDFSAGSAKLNLRGDSVAELIINEKLWVDLDGDSELRYGGSPQIMQSRIKGDSEMEKLD